jgi:hypothetical protein
VEIQNEMNPEIQLTRLNFLYSITSLSLFLTELRSVIQISHTSAKEAVRSNVVSNTCRMSRPRSMSPLQ